MWTGVVQEDFLKEMVLEWTLSTEWIDFLLVLAFHAYLMKALLPPPLHPVVTSTLLKSLSSLSGPHFWP